MVLVCIAAKSVVLIKNIEILDRAQNRSPYWESVLRPVFYVKVTDMVDFKIGELSQNDITRVSQSYIKFILQNINELIDDVSK